LHEGYDIYGSAGEGSAIVAARAGNVFRARLFGTACGSSYGYAVYVDHANGYQTRYAHLKSFAVSEGQWVEAGQLIGYEGKTGNACSTPAHLHFELRKNLVALDYNHEMLLNTYAAAGSPLAFSGEWHLNLNADGLTDQGVYFGARGDIPIVGDWNNDGVDTVGVVRFDPAANNLKWYFSNTPLHAAPPWQAVPVSLGPITYGDANDIPVTGDWDNNNQDTPGVVRLVSGGLKWYLDNQFGTASDQTFNYGNAGDYPIVGDWQCLGTDTPGITRRASNGNLHWRLNYGFDGKAEKTFDWGLFLDDFPLAGDWQVNNCDRPIVSRAGAWYLQAQLDGSAHEGLFYYGALDDYPLVLQWDSDSFDEYAIVR